MFGGVSNMMPGLGGSSFEDENKKSLISDIKNYFTKSIRPGMITGQQIGS